MRAFFKGIASMMSFMFPLREDPEIKRILERSDAEALQEDWNQVGQDMREAMGHEQNQRRTPEDG